MGLDFAAHNVRSAQSTNLCAVVTAVRVVLTSVTPAGVAGVPQLSRKTLQILHFPEQLRPRPILSLLHASWMGVDTSLHGTVHREGEGRELIAGVPARP